MIKRPENEEEMQQREAIGVIRASRFVRNYARTHESISIKTVCDIHRRIFSDAWPEIAGSYRDENLEITESKHLPPHHIKVSELMEEADLNFNAKLKNLNSVEGLFFVHDKANDGLLQKIDDIVMTAAWIHHTITHIHPFREGNGRTARLAGNLVLERYGLAGISIKVEKENKNRYRQALAQIDIVGDYEPLKNIIYEGLIERYNGVNVKYFTP